MVAACLVGLEPLPEYDRAAYPLLYEGQKLWSHPFAAVELVPTDVAGAESTVWYQFFRRVPIGGDQFGAIPAIQLFPADPKWTGHYVFHQSELIVTIRVSAENKRAVLTEKLMITCFPVNGIPIFKAKRIGVHNHDIPNPSGLVE